LLSVDPTSLRPKPEPRRFITEKKNRPVFPTTLDQKNLHRRWSFLADPKIDEISWSAKTTSLLEILKGTRMSSAPTAVNSQRHCFVSA